MPIFKWRIYCITENNWVEIFNDSPTDTITKCPNDHSHEINDQSQCIVQKIEDLVVKIKQENASTQGNFRIEGKSMGSMQPNETIEIEYSLKHNVNLLAVWIIVNDENKGDVFNAYYQPAVAFEGTKITENKISVPSYLLQYLNKGYILVHDNVEYEIIDNGNDSIELDSVLPGDIGGTLLQLKFRINGVRNFNLARIGRHCVGSNNIGSSYMPKEGKIVAKYTNKSNVTKNFYYDLEYMY